MYRTLFVFFFIMIFQWAKAQNFLVTGTNDTILIKGLLETNHKDPARWNSVTANGVTYKLREIKCIQLGEDFYYNLHQRRIWKRVAEGKINVFALYDRDTLRDERGRLRKTLYIQKEATDLLPYNVKNLLSFMKDDDSLYHSAKNKMQTGRGAKGLMAAGIATMGVSAFTLLIEAFVALLSDDVENLEIYAVVSATGLVTGAGALTTGIVMNKRSKYLNLDPVYYYNLQH